MLFRKGQELRERDRKQLLPSTTMLKIIQKIKPKTAALIRSDLAELDKYLTPDVSNYAKGRTRLWIKWQYDLRNKTIRPAIQPSDRLWTYCQNICQIAGFQPDLGLIAKGKTGIALHRDAGYAMPLAVSIQIGRAEWTYDCQYPGWEWQPSHKCSSSNPQIILLEDCAVAFNCKNPHSANPTDENRYSINLWQLKPEYKRMAT
jgi:hypothetical protein